MKNQVIMKLITDLKFFLFLILVALLYWNRILFFEQILWIGDITRQYFPWYFELHQHLRAFKLPLWELNMGGGYPLFAQGEVGVFYPLNWILIFLFSPTSGFNLAYFLHSLIASFSSYILARVLNLSKPAALLTALTFSYSFFFSTRFIHPSIIFCASYLPLGLWCIEKMFITKQPRVGLWLSLVVALQFLAGHPQITFISILAYVSYSFFRLLFFWQRPETTTKYILIIILAIGVGIGIAAVQVLPTFELSRYSSRITQGNDFIFSYSLPQSHYLTYLFPYLFGLSTANSNIGFLQFGGHYWEFALYIGIFPFLCALASLSAIKKNKSVRLWSSFLIIFMFCAVGGYFPPYRFLVRILHLPFRVSARFLLPVTLGISVLTGFGLDALLSRRSNVFKFLSLPILMITLFLLLATLNTNSINVFLTQVLKKSIFVQFQKLTFDSFSLNKTTIAVSFLFIAVGFFNLYLFYKHRLSRTGFILFAFGLFFCDSFLQSYLYQQTSPIKEVMKPPALNQYINKNQRIFTFTESGNNELEKNTIQPNLNLVWSINSFNAITPLPLLDHIESEKLIKTNLISGLSFSGSKYVVTQNPLTMPELKLLTRNQYSYLYEYIVDEPRVYLVNVYATVTRDSPLKQLSFITPEKEIFTDEKITDFSSKPDLSILYKLEEKLYSEERISYTVRTQKPAMLIQRDSFYPGWLAVIDGKVTPIFKANNLFRAVEIPVGTHQLEFMYTPKSLWLGLVISFISSVLFITFYSISIFNKSKL